MFVGAFFERPQANTVRPYRMSGKHPYENQPNSVRFFLIFLQHRLSVDRQLELQAELFRSLTAKDHTIDEDFKIIHD